MCAVFNTCKDCFIGITPIAVFSRCSHEDKVMYMTWNAVEGRCETTEKSVRDFPSYWIGLLFPCVSQDCAEETVVYLHMVGQS